MVRYMLNRPNNNASKDNHLEARMKIFMPMNNREKIKDTWPKSAKYEMRSDY